jgi:hypothetical protein
MQIENQIQQNITHYELILDQIFEVWKWTLTSSCF